ncbi:MAG: orotidine-5'-phosphate decarboxylase [Candidatus Sungbacteria bacterium]|nr:orotidine-5'-phosphate decarboxylase [Candidatus Sungbacteria bacterium]
MSTVPAEDRVFLALDNMGLDRSVKLVEKLQGRANVKINDLWDAAGAPGLRQLRDAGARRVWVDSKVVDIPNTVANRIRQITIAGAEFITVMAEGEVDMMIAARKARKACLDDLWGADTATVEAFAHEPGIIAVTVLTSLDEEQTHETFGRPVKAQALHLARLAKLAGLRYCVSSPREAEYLSTREELAGMGIWTPGIRPTGIEAGDQKRFDTPAFAIKAKAARIVVGRAVTEAEDPVAAYEAILAEVDAARAA